MSKRSTISVLALVSMLSTAAWAQQPPGGSTAPSSPPTDMPAAAAPTGAPRFIAMQQPSEKLASEIRGLTVKNNSDESVGNVSDLVIGADGKVTAILIGVGGFLGIGASDVAVGYDAVKISTDKNGGRFINLNVTRDMLDKAQKYVTVKAQADGEKARQSTTPGGGQPGRKN